MTMLDRMRAHLETHNWPRLHCLLMVTLAGAAAFLSSFLLLSLDVPSMAVRYGVAALVGYLTFVMLVRAWVAWKRHQFESEIDVGNVLDAVTPHDLSPALPRGSEDPPMFAGGRSGGGGASGSYGGGSPSGFSLALDADDLIWLIVVAAAAVAGVAAIAYVVWVAPALLAEIILDVAIAGRIYKGLRRRDSAHWTRHVFRRTALPAAIVIVFAVVAGYGLQRIAPAARSIGGVWAHVTAR
jgi:hypothetical protein